MPNLREITDIQILRYPGQEYRLGRTEEAVTPFGSPKLIARGHYPVHTAVQVAEQSEYALACIPRLCEVEKEARVEADASAEPRPSS